MIICEGSSNLMRPTVLHWSDMMFVLAATCTATVSAALNFGLLASAVFVGATTRHPITMQLCLCGVMASAALLCHVRHVWVKAEFGNHSPYPTTCKTLDLATLFSHCTFVCLILLDLRFSSRRVILSLLSFISWCVVGLVSLAAGISCSPTAAILVFCFYVLHIPLIILLVVNHKSSRTVVPRDVMLTLQPSSAKRVIPQVLLLLLGTMPQAFLVAAEALKMKPFPNADAWCCLAISLIAAFRPLLDIILLPELGDAVVGFIGSLCRRKHSS